jgi:hypothetical protein
VGKIQDIDVSVGGQHLVLRPVPSVQWLLGFFGACGLALSIFGLVQTPVSDWLFPTILGLGSTAVGLFYATTQVHATPSRLWLRRYGLEVWSVPMSRAGTVEGVDGDWRLIFVFDLESGKRVGAINWWVLNEKERVELAKFVDQARQALGVAL